MSLIVGIQPEYCGHTGASWEAFLDYGDTATGIQDVYLPIIAGTYRFQIYRPSFVWIYQVEGYNPILPMPLWWNMLHVDVYHRALCGVINPTPYGGIEVATPGFVFPSYSPVGGADCSVTPPNPPADTDMTEDVKAFPGGNLCDSFTYDLDPMDEPCPTTECTTAIFSFQARKIRNNPRFRIRFQVFYEWLVPPP